MNKDQIGGEPTGSAAGRGTRAPTASFPLQLHIIAPCGGDPFAAGAMRAAQFLAGPSPSEPPVTLDGTATPALVGRSADRWAAAIVVLATPDVDSKERRRYADRACRIAAATRHPVLVVPQTPSWPPRRCVAAMDFSRAAIGAAIMAFDLLACPGQVAHVFIDALVAPGSHPDEPSVPRHIRLLFDALPTSLRQRPAMVVTQHCLRGARVPLLVEFAATWGADLLSFGRQGHPPLTGKPDDLFGPTVRGLLEAAPCSLVLSGAADGE